MVLWPVLGTHLLSPPICQPLCFLPAPRLCGWNVSGRPSGPNTMVERACSASGSTGKYGEEGCEHQKPLLAQLYFLMAKWRMGAVGFFWSPADSSVLCMLRRADHVFFYWRKRKLLYKLKFSKGKFQVGYWKIWWGQSKRSTVFWVALGSHQCTELRLPTSSKPQVKALVWKLHGVPL